MITIEDDCKEKYQSVTATIHFPTDAHWSGFFSGEIVGYGATEAEAKKHLLEQAKKASLFIAESALELHSVAE